MGQPKDEFGQLDERRVAEERLAVYRLEATGAENRFVRAWYRFQAGRLSVKLAGLIGPQDIPEDLPEL